MDFAPSETQSAVREAAERALAQYDVAGSVPAWSEVWGRLRRADLIEACTSGDEAQLCAVEVLAALGRQALHTPLHGTVALASVLAAYGTEACRSHWSEELSSGAASVVPAVAEVGVDRLAATRLHAMSTDEGAWAVSGTVLAVPFAAEVDRLALWARTPGAIGVFLVPPDGAGVRLTPSVSTTGEQEFVVDFDSAPVEPDDVVCTGSGGAELLRQHLLVALSAEQLGLAETALQLTARYTAQREQFGRPIATFQSVSGRAADAFIDVAAMRWTTYQAADALAAGGAAEAVAIAKFWACEAGARVMATAIHLHGGVGVDVTYPIHRFFLRTRRVEMLLGGSGAQLAQLWEAMQS